MTKLSLNEYKDRFFLNAIVGTQGNIFSGLGYFWYFSPVVLESFPDVWYSVTIIMLLKN